MIYTVKDLELCVGQRVSFIKQGNKTRTYGVLKKFGNAFYDVNNWILYSSSKGFYPDHKDLRLPINKSKITLGGIKNV